MAPLTRLVFATGAFLILTPAILHGQSAIVDGVAAIVNDKVITFSEVKKQVDNVERTLRETYSGTELGSRIREARLSALKALIEKELIIQDFNKKGYFLPESFVEDRLKEVIQTQFDGDRTAFTRTIQANGVSLEQYKKEILENLIVSAMRAHNVIQTVIVSPYKIEKYYQENVREFNQDEQIKISIILLRKALFPEKRTKADGQVETYDPAEGQTQEILTKLDSGADFADMAKAFSEGKNREIGGDWGWVTKKDLRPEIVEAASQLQPGQTSRMITTQDGYYIVRLIDIKRARVQPISEVRADIERVLIQQDRQEVYQEWLNSLRAKAYIKMF